MTLRPLAVITLAACLCAQNPREAALAAHDRGEHQQAAEQLYRLIKAGAHDKDALLKGAESLEKVGRFNDALDALSIGKRKFPGEARFRVGLCRVYSLQAASLVQASGKMDSHAVFQFQDAIREAEALLKTTPENRDARLIMAHSLYQLGEWDKARVQSEELTKRFPAHPGGHILMGDLAFRHYQILRGKRGEAAAGAQHQAKLKASLSAAHASYQKAIELDASRVVAHRKLGDVYAWNAQVEKALAAYGKALSLAPQAKVPHTWIDQNLEPERRFEFYEKLGLAFIAAHPERKKEAAVFAWYAAGALLAQKEYLKGERMYLQSAHFNPEYKSAYYYAMYSAYFYRENYDDALDYAAMFAKQAPIQFADLVRALPEANRDSIQGLLTFLARRAVDTGKAAASRDLNHTLAALIDTADAWNNYAFLCRETGKFSESERAYRHALEIEPNSGQLKNDLGVILHYHSRDKKKWREARQLYQQAIKDARRVLADKESSLQARKVATQTVSDAKGNLAHLAELFKQAR